MSRIPMVCVWEVTMGCNMRCGHCGSSCEKALPDELTTEEAFDVIDQLKDLNIEWVTLSGGEPTTRTDIKAIIDRLHDRGVTANMITNGLLVDRDFVRDIKGKLTTVVISVDGTEEIHDSIRVKGAYKNAFNVYKILKEEAVPAGCITTITKRNIDILPDLKEALIDAGVNSWQIQIGLPMGNLEQNNDWVLDKEQIGYLLDFCYESSKEGRIYVFPADCIGYYTKKELEIRQRTFGQHRADNWDGCNAGMRGFGLLHNGDVLGCTSIRDKEFVEGNIRDRRLVDIWNDPNCFVWRTGLKKTDLKGECSICVYGSKCLGGCPNTRLTMNKDLYSENQFCLYNQSMKQMRVQYSEISDVPELINMMNTATQENDYQRAAFISDRILELDADNVQALLVKGYNEFMCGNYEECVQSNKKALELMPDDPYALKGLGLGLLKAGKGAEGVKYVERAAKLTNYKDEDILNDLRFMQEELAV